MSSFSSRTLKPANIIASVSDISPGEPTVVGAAWRYRAVVLVVLLAFLGAGLVYAEARGPVYTATASLELEDPHSAPVFANPTNQPPDRYVGDQVTVLKSADVAQAAALAGTKQKPPIHLTPEYVSAHLAVTDSPLSGSLVQLTFTANAGTTAMAGVDAVVTAYEAVVRTAVEAQLSSVLSQIDNELTSINAQLTAVQARLAGPARPDQQALVQQEQALFARQAVLSQKKDQVVVDAASPTPGVALYLPAQKYVHTSKLVADLPILGLAAILGLLVGVSAAYLFASRRRTFLGRTEPEAVLNAPLVSEIPRFDHAKSALPAADAAGP